ncbi:MAG: hypothetical protein HC868_00810 [Sphingomonadales bacterium]|nr:hypothetical protein [Sphingomonadales bacterium]
MISTDKTPEAMDMRELSLDEIEEISGAGIRSFLSKVAKKIKSIFSGDGDVRRPTDRPGTPGVPPQ